MTRREYRIQCMKFLYLLSMGGDYELEEIDKEVYDNINNLILHTDEIEEILDKSMTGWSLKQINLVDQAILKYAIYEMKFLKLPHQIAINEALEITKEYSDSEGKQVAFNNKVLDKAKEYIN